MPGGECAEDELEAVSIAPPSRPTPNVNRTFSISHPHQN